MWMIVDETANWPSDDRKASFTPKIDVPLYFGGGDDRILIGHADVSADGRCDMRFNVPGHDIVVQAVSDLARPGEFSLGFYPNPLELIKQGPLSFEPESYFKLRGEVEENIRQFTVDEINHKLLHGNGTDAKRERMWNNPGPLDATADLYIESFKKRTTGEDESS
jgi:hypothetical protein